MVTMDIYFSLRNNGRFYLSAFLLIAFIIYIMHHMFYSENSISGRKNLEARALHLQEKAFILKQRRIHVQREAQLLRPDTLDRELLEEKARNLLMLTDPSEKVILYPIN